MTKDCQAWLDRQANEFMEPFAEYFDTDEEGVGWYARLSAPGFLDCTDWIGPYASEDEALEALYETYGDDC